MLIAKFPYRQNGKWYHGQMRFSSHHIPSPNAVKNAIAIAYPTAFLEHAKYKNGAFEIEESGSDEWRLKGEA